MRPLDSDAIALSSPSGKMSKAALARAQERIRKQLFDGVSIGPVVVQPSEKEILLRQAEGLRYLANGGMNSRAYTRRAKELEARAAKL